MHYNSKMEIIRCYIKMSLNKSNPNVLCLLPVRNGEQHLLSYFENVRQFANGIIALDDGSIDGTIKLLNEEPLVLEVISHPKRDSYAGWDDSYNRQKLLNASAKYKPKWILWLDADELIAPCDIPLVHKLIDDIAVSGNAYAFEVLRMVGDLEHFDLHKLWVYRFFHYQKEQCLPQSRLHFDPIPTDIPETHQFRTIIRILHKGSMTSDDRRLRFRKYKEADPKLVWQSSYINLLKPPGYLWKLRPYITEEILILP